MQCNYFNRKSFSCWMAKHYLLIDITSSCSKKTMNSNKGTLKSYNSLKFYINQCNIKQPSTPQLPHLAIIRSMATFVIK